MSNVYLYCYSKPCDQWRPPSEVTVMSLTSWTLLTTVPKGHTIRQPQLSSVIRCVLCVFFFFPPIFILLIVRGYTDTMMPWHWRGPSLFSPLKSKKMKKYQRSKQPCITGWNGKCKYSAAGDSSKSTICGWDETIHSNKFNIILFVWAWFTSTNLQSGCVLIKQTLLIFAIGRECFHGNCELWATRVDYVI